MDSNTADIFLTKSRETFPEEHEWYAKVRQNADLVQEFSGISMAEYNPHILIYKFRKSEFSAAQQQPYSLTSKSVRIKQRKSSRRKP
jgi:hypothetical protein